MNKLKALQKRLGIEAAIVLVALAIVGGIMSLTGGMAQSAAEKKAQAEAGLSQDTAQLNSIRSQLERSGEAEKRFVDIQLARTNSDFTNNVDALKEWMREAKNRYRFANNFKLNLPPEVPSDKSELSGMDYNITVRNDVTIELEAISDLHVFSFMRALRGGPPGFVRITQVDIERRGDMQPQVIAQMLGGVAPYLVTAKIQFEWVGINPKAKPADGAPADGEVAP